jgi:hypothetical protein
MMEEVKRFEISNKLDADGVVSWDNLSLEGLARHQRDTGSEDKVTTGDPKCE